MSLFIGSNAGETITPGFVSPSVKVIGSPNKPSAAVDFIFAGGGDDVVEGGAGNDFAFLGAGNDKFTWKPGDGSDFVDGGKGDDTLVFDGANINETINISSSVHGLASFTRDAGNITMTLNKVERIEFNALGGQDKITVKDLGRTDVEEVAIDLGGILGAAGGDGQVDQVIAEGTNGADTIEVLAGGTSATVAGLAASLTIADLEAADQLVINALDGDDTISAATVPAGVMKLTIDGGAGDDTIVGSSGADLLIGGAGNDDVRGGRGNDVASLGEGDDIFTWDPGEGSDVVEGEAGFDAMVFNGNNADEDVDISANGERATFFRNPGNVTMDLDDVERIEFAALGGQDKIVVNDLSGTGVSQVAIDLAGVLGGGAGDGQADQVTINGTAQDDIVQVTLSGISTVVDGLAAQVSIDHFEAANDLLVINAGAGDDVLLGGDGDDVLDGGEGEDFLVGNAGDDTFVNGEFILGFVAGAGTEDRIDLRNVAGVGDFDSIIANFQDVGGSAVLALENGGLMTLLNVSVAALHADDFIL